MKKAFFLILFIAALLGVNHKASANGGLFSSSDKSVTGGDQKALIYFHDNTEDLVLSMRYSGSAEDFAWVIPTPTKPTGDIGSQKLFQDLQELTTSDDYYLNHNSSENGSTQGTANIFDTTVFQATDANSLSLWLSENGFYYSEKNESLINKYVSSNWFFVAAKVKSGALEPSAQSEIQPLHLSFSTDKIIYPILLSKMTFLDSEASTNEGELISDNSPMVTLYVLNNHKVENSTLGIVWANWIQKDSIKNIANDSNSTKWLNINNDLFLTKMSAIVDLNNINDDLFFKQSEKDSIFPAPFYREASFWAQSIQYLALFLLIAFVSPFWLFFVICLILQKYDSIRFARIGIFIEVALTIIAFFLFFIPFWINEGMATKQWFADPGLDGYYLAVIILFLTELFFTVRKMLLPSKNQHKQNN